MSSNNFFAHDSLFNDNMLLGGKTGSGVGFFLSNMVLNLLANEVDIAIIDPFSGFKHMRKLVAPSVKVYDLDGLTGDTLFKAAKDAINEFINRKRDEEKQLAIIIDNAWVFMDNLHQELAAHMSQTATTKISFLLASQHLSDFEKFPEISKNASIKATLDIDGVTKKQMVHVSVAGATPNSFEVAFSDDTHKLANPKRGGKND